jgi:hypothetical protein
MLIKSKNCRKEKKFQGEGKEPTSGTDKSGANGDAQGL